MFDHCSFVLRSDENLAVAPPYHQILSFNFANTLPIGDWSHWAFHVFWKVCIPDPHEIIGADLSRQDQASCLRSSLRANAMSTCRMIMSSSNRAPVRLRRLLICGQRCNMYDGRLCCFLQVAMKNRTKHINESVSMDERKKDT